MTAIAFDFWRSSRKRAAVAVSPSGFSLLVLLSEFFTVGRTMFRVALTTRPGSLLQSSALLLLVVFMPLGSLPVTNGQRWRKGHGEKEEKKKKERSKQLCHEISLRLVMPRIRSRSLGKSLGKIIMISGWNCGRRHVVLNSWLGVESCLPLLDTQQSRTESLFAAALDQRVFPARLDWVFLYLGKPEDRLREGGGHLLF